MRMTGQCYQESYHQKRGKTCGSSQTKRV